MHVDPSPMNDDTYTHRVVEQPVLQGLAERQRDTCQCFRNAAYWPGPAIDTPSILQPCPGRPANSMFCLNETVSIHKLSNPSNFIESRTVVNRPTRAFPSSAIALEISVVKGRITRSSDSTLTKFVLRAQPS